MRVAGTLLYTVLCTILKTLLLAKRSHGRGRSRGRRSTRTLFRNSMSQRQRSPGRVPDFPGSGRVRESCTARSGWSARAKERLYVYKEENKYELRRCVLARFLDIITFYPRWVKGKRVWQRGECGVVVSGTTENLG